jgi:rod shape-determining protein MreC
MVDYVQNEEKVDQGEWFYTSGDDGVFPKGLPVGTVTVARQGNPNKLVYVAPSGLQGGLEEVLIVMEGVHQPIPEAATAAADVHLQPPPPAEGVTTVPQNAAGEPVMTTEADRLRSRYKKIGEAQAHKFGENLPGTKPPDFNMTPEEVAAREAKAAAQASGIAPAPAGTAGAQTAAPNAAPSGATERQPAERKPAVTPPAPAQPNTTPTGSARPAAAAPANP